jgi:hypothetical protein
MIRQSGSLDKTEDKEEALVIRGEYTFIDPKGHAHTVTYVADKNGTFLNSKHFPKTTIINRSYNFWNLVGFRPMGEGIPVINSSTQSKPKETLLKPKMDKVIANTTASSRSKNDTIAQRETPLKTISASLFSSPGQTF